MLIEFRIQPLHFLMRPDEDVLYWCNNAIIATLFIGSKSSATKRARRASGVPMLISSKAVAVTRHDISISCSKASCVR